MANDRKMMVEWVMLGDGVKGVRVVMLVSEVRVRLVFIFFSDERSVTVMALVWRKVNIRVRDFLSIR